MSTKAIFTLALPNMRSLNIDQKKFRINTCTFNPLTVHSIFNLLVIEQQQKPALAAICALGNGLKGEEGYWLAADPIELRVDASQIILMGRDHLRLTKEEAAHLVSTLNRFLKQDNLQLQVGNSNEWYIQLCENKPIKTHEIIEVIAKDIRDFLPGDEQKYWRLLLTELQILLSNHEINHDRSLRNEAPVNSLWFWGEGQITTKYQIHDWSCIWSDHSLVKGAMKLVDNRVPYYPEDEFDVEKINSGNYLMISSSFCIKDLLTKLLVAVEKGRIHTLKLLLGNGMNYQIRKKFWNFRYRHSERARFRCHSERSEESPD